MAHRGRKNADEAFVAAYACGATVENAAAKAGISRTTAHRRLLDPAIQKRIAEFKDETLRRTCAALTAAGLESVKTLLDLQNLKSREGVRLGAARAIIQLGLRMREQSDILERMAELEANFNKGDAAK
jgi:hypothetical protein